MSEHATLLLLLLLLYFYVNQCYNDVKMDYKNERISSYTSFQSDVYATTGLPLDSYHVNDYYVYARRRVIKIIQCVRR